MSGTGGSNGNSPSGIKGISAASNEKKIKCVVVGDSRTGKRELINALVQLSPSERIHINTTSDKTMFECKETEVQIGSNTYVCSFFCPNGQEEFERLRPLLYQETDIFIIAFSISDIISLENIKNKWHPEIHNYSPQVPFILVGTKSDLRSGSSANISKELVKKHDGNEMAQILKALCYIECSVKSKENLKVLFDTVITQKASVKNSEADCGCCVM